MSDLFVKDAKRGQVHMYCIVNVELFIYVIMKCQILTHIHVSLEVEFPIA